MLESDNLVETASMEGGYCALRVYMLMNIWFIKYSRILVEILVKQINLINFPYWK